MQQANPEWKGKVINNPDLFAHERDLSLLPRGAVNPGEYVTCYDPSSGTHIETLKLDSGAAVAAKVAAADAAQRAWVKTTFAQRKSLLRSLKAWILRDMDAIVDVAVRDTGKTRVDAVFGEILTTFAKIDWLLKHGEKALQPETRSGSLLLAHKISKVRS